MEIRESMCLNQNQLSILIEPKDKKEDFRFYMLQNNTIGFLLSMQKIYEEHAVRYLYDTTEKEALSHYTKGKRLREPEIKQLVRQLLEALVKGGDYYLDEDSYLMKPEYIYLDTQKESYFFCYCPDYVEPIRKQLGDMIAYLMNEVDYEDLAAVKLVYLLYQMIGEESFSTKKILHTVDNYRFDGEKSREQTPIITLTPELELVLQKEIEYHSQNQPEQNIPYAPPVSPKPCNVPPPSPPYVNPSLSINHPLPEQQTSETGNYPQKGTLIFVLVTIVLLVMFCACYVSGFLYTKIGHQLDLKKMLIFVVLALVVEGYTAWKVFGEQDKKTDSSIPKGYKLVPTMPGMKDPVYIRQFPFSIGKDSTRVHGTILDPLISRMHAVFLMEEDKLYLKDLSSLNGTYVNEIRIIPENSILLHEGDTIRFASTVYQLAK